jgi:hypothetical protein
MRQASYVLLLACLVACRSEMQEEPGEPPAQTPRPPDAEDWVTPAEASGFRATPDCAETMAFLRRLESAMPEMRITRFGTSAQGREMPLVIVSKDRAFTPHEARQTGLPVVLIQNGIHSGEIDGKDACLMILRDVLLGENRWILDGVILLVVPIYNVDGHERISPYNRPNQDGPVEGMGFRTTAAGLDLNRDHMKVVSPEARALVSLIDAWRPHMHVDDHVTDGSDHDWVLTWAWLESPQLAGPVDAWMKEHMPAVTAGTEKMGHRNGPYVWMKDPMDPAKGFYTTMRSPRLSTGYLGLRNRPSILVEMHSHKPYEKRVPANRDFLLALLRQVSDHGRELVDAVEEAERRTVELGRPGAEASPIVLTWKVTEPPDTIAWPVYRTHVETSVVTGQPLLRFDRGVVDEKVVPWYHVVEPDLTLERPRGYLVLPGWPQIEERLAAHGLVVERLKEPVELEVEVMRVSDPEHEKESYNGEILMTASVERKSEQRSFPAGTLWIPADQPDFELAVQLLEPEAPDSLLSWGFLRRVLEQKTWIGDGTLEDLVVEMLQDPVTAAQWQEMLQDEAFASDARARKLWWYRRTDHWDETWGLYPVMRVMHAPSLVTGPWKPQP